MSSLRIGIYNEPAGGSLGGSDYLASILAAGIPEGHSVDLLHHHTSLTHEGLSSFIGADTSRINLKRVDRHPFQLGTNGSLIGGLCASRAWHAEFSQPYDVFVAIVHWIPPVCQAGRGVLVVLFPFFRPRESWPLNDLPKGRFDLRRTIRNRLYRNEWRRRLRSYSSVTSISQFTRTWTREFWQADSEVIYPPVPVDVSVVPKSDRIISVGRFTTSGHTKKQLELVELFGSLTEIADRGWVYETIGPIGTTPNDRAYFDAVSQLARRTGAVVSINLSKPELQHRYATAKLFVHAAGLGEPTDKPELAEHFGITTVEAMAAGCVPLVVNRGAQPEIVQHGVSGYVWSSLDELADQVRTLTRDDSLRERLAVGARARAHSFSQQSFIDRMNTVILSSSTSRRRQTTPAA